MCSDVLNPFDMSTWRRWVVRVRAFSGLKYESIPWHFAYKGTATSVCHRYPLNPHTSSQIESPLNPHKSLWIHPAIQVPLLFAALVSPESEDLHACVAGGFPTDPLAASFRCSDVAAEADGNLCCGAQEVPFTPGDRYGMIWQGSPKKQPWFVASWNFPQSD